MKKIYLTLSSILYCTIISYSQNSIGIGTSTPNASAALDISSNNKGLLIPRMNTAVRTAISSPATGLMVYDTDLKQFYFYNGIGWSAVGSFALPYLANVNINSSAFKIENSGAGAAIDAASSADFGTGMTATSTGSGGWGLSAVAGRPGAIAIRAYADSGTAFSAENVYPENTSILLSLINRGKGRTANFQLTNASSHAANVQIAGNHLGEGLLIYQTNTVNSSPGISVQNAGTGPGLSINMSNTSNISEVIKIDQGGIGGGININLPSPSNSGTGLNIENLGIGRGVYANCKGGTALYGATQSISAAGVYGSNITGEAVVGVTAGPHGVGAVVGRNDSTGSGVRGFCLGSGYGVLGQAGISGGIGVGGWFENVNAFNSNTVLVATGNGPGAVFLAENTNVLAATNLAVFKKSGANVARINDAGKGFFNGGTQSSGADVAEAFAVTEPVENYEPGDVLAISTSKKRTVEKSSVPYSNLVAGVYATKPGVLLTEENIDANLTGKVPMGVIGVIPTKVCLEGGEIKAGDLLVSSSVPGVAMKADIDKVKIGQCIGKALEDFSSTAPGKINVLVSIK